MSKLSECTKPKSTQTNADDLIAGPMVIIITEVIADPSKSQQKVTVKYKGDNNKHWYPCITMTRIMMMKWGDDESLYVGRSIKIYRDPTVKFAGEEVGGIAISHMTHMKDDSRFLLTSSRGQKKAYKIEHLILKANKTPEEIKADQTTKANVFASQAKTEIEEINSLEGLADWKETNGPTMKRLESYEDATKILTDALDLAEHELKDGTEKGEE